jgi:hypothetical protein
LPSIEQVLPWLHLLFEAWEDYKLKRQREAIEATERDAKTQEALTEHDHDAVLFDDDDDDDRRKKKDKKRRKDKNKDKKNRK